MLGHQRIMNTQRYLPLAATGELRTIMGRTSYLKAARAKR